MHPPQLTLVMFTTQPQAGKPQSENRGKKILVDFLYCYITRSHVVQDRYKCELVGISAIGKRNRSEEENNNSLAGC